MGGENDIVVRITGYLDASLQDATQGAKEAVQAVQTEFRKSAEEREKQVAAFHAANEALVSDSKLYEKTVAELTKTVGDNTVKLSARLDVLRDPAMAFAIREEAAMRVEVENLSKKILEETAGTRENVAAVKAKEAAEVAARASAQAWNAQVAGVTESLANQNRALLAQQQAMKSPEYQEHLAANKRLKEEIAAMTGATVKNTAETKVADAVESGIFSNMRTRREALVMAHEAVTGSYKRMLGSAMVFGEYSNAGWMEKLTASINPYTVAITLAGVATIGLVHHYVELSEKAAETYHEAAEMGERLGVTAEQMEGLGYATIGTKVKTEEVARAISTFSVRLEEHRAKFAALGITAQEPVRAFEQFIDAANRAASESERNRILEEGLGKSWQQLVPIINEGGKALEEAIQKGKLPPDVRKDYEDMIQYQKLTAQAEWEADRAAAQHASSIALENEKMKTGLALMRQKFGLVGGTVLYGLDLASSGMSDRNVKTYAETLAEQEAKKASANAPAIKRGGSETVALTEEQQKAYEQVQKELGKKNIDVAIKLVKDEWNGRLLSFRAGSKEYNDAVKAEAQAEQDVRDSFAKKNKGKKPKSDDSARSSLYDMVGRDEREAQSSDVAASGDGSVSASIMAKSAAELKRYENARAELLKARDRLTVETAADAAQVNAGLAALAQQHQANLTKIEKDGDTQRAALNKKADAEYLKEVQERAKKAEDLKLKAMKEAFQREQAEYEADLAKKKRYFDAISSISQNLSERFGSLASSITSMGIKGDLTFHKVAQSIKEMSIDIVAQFVGMVAKILAEVALLKAADVATDGMVSMVLTAYNNSASLLNYASGGKWGGDGGNTSANSTQLSFDVGTPSVPRDMTARIHAREGIVPATFMDGIRRGELTLGGPSGSSSSSSSVYHDNRSWTIPTTISRAELAPMLDRTKASAIRGGFNKVSR